MNEIDIFGLFKISSFQLMGWTLVFSIGYGIQSVCIVLNEIKAEIIEIKEELSEHHSDEKQALLDISTEISNLKNDGIDEENLY
ncbi:MAG: hypothetical protein JKY89_00285 [Immundisolibacteraceae bacterium]|nr:hypothetical protein [Immundisolibacteraceae bacterium]